MQRFAEEWYAMHHATTSRPRRSPELMAQAAAKRDAAMDG